MNGAELKTMLENGVSMMPAVEWPLPAGRGALLHATTSGGCREPGDCGQSGSTRQELQGRHVPRRTAIDLTAGSTYKIAENDFMASGGDGYPNFFSRATTQGIMDQVLADYIDAQTPPAISPAIQGRIQCTTSGATACPVVTP